VPGPYRVPYRNSTPCGASDTIASSATSASAAAPNAGEFTSSGRRTEQAALDRLLAEARAGQSRVLVLRGEAGVGKTALLDYLQEQASGFRVARAAGVESEMELAFAGLHQLCTPMLSNLAGLPGPQRDALGTVFGLSTGQAPDRLLVGLAVLGLLSEVAEGAAARVPGR
jgi:AAA ATPase domain